MKVIAFPQSDKISTYLFAICAGPYKYLERNDPGFPPMRVYYRRCIDYDFNEMIDVTQAGMKFYEDYFGIAYPFKKYDQVLVLQHVYYAMENVGCVTFSEEYLRRGNFVTEGARISFANTNLHELAHHWFGDLVTMKWWNDLWLNESFATFMAFLCMENCSFLKEKYPTFMHKYHGYKYEGIELDCCSQTHPIINDCQTTDEAMANFDGISYGKGAAFLKQLYHIIGHETLSKALKSYFAKH